MTMMYPSLMHAAALQAQTIPVSEVFGPTLQGEGPHTGRPVWFVRLGLCNLHCSWCDTPYTWDTTRYDVKAECPDTPITDIHAELKRLGANTSSTVVVSGGEPLVHHHKLGRLIDPRLHTWHVESNGTIPPPKWWKDSVAHTSLSPKIHDQGDPEKRRLRPKVLEQWADLTLRGHSLAWKFVIRHDTHGASPGDLTAVDELVATYGIPHRNVWLMPEGTVVHRILEGQRALAQPAIDRGYNLTTRLHTLIWNDERAH